MPNESSIKYISELLAHPAGITDGDHSSILLYRQTYPYFIPARYMEALENHKDKAFAPQMLSAIRPYMGNWMLFCDFLAEGLAPKKERSEAVKPPATEQGKAMDKKKVPDTVQQVPDNNNEPEIPVNGVKKVTDELPVPAPVAVSQPAEPVASVIKKVEQTVVAAPLPAVPPAKAEPVLEIRGIIPEEEKVPVMEQPVAIPVQEVTPAPVAEVPVDSPAKEELIAAVYTGDYFLQQGEKVPESIPAEITDRKKAADLSEEEKALMVMMSFSDWLLHFKNNSSRQQEEKKEQKALKTMWQKEKLAAAIEEENDEIPENVFEMAVNSIAKEDGLASESLADIYIKQGKYDKAIDMYRKLSLRNPQKSTYFARKIEEVLKEKQS